MRSRNPPVKRARVRNVVPPPVFDTPHAHAAYDSSGLLLYYRFKPTPPGRNGGCGSPTHVVGTNGGTMPCGHVLRGLDGVSAPYYCGVCADMLEKSRDSRCL